MSWVLITFAACACLGLFLVVAALSRHKNSATREIQLVGSRARVDSPLAPQGTVLVHGELWNARAADGTRIEAQTIVQVVGLSGHLLLVER